MNWLSNYKLEGTQLNIETFPSPVLKKVATKVENFDEEIEQLCKNMLFTMYNAPGIGLAAPQVGISKRIFVLDSSFKRELATDSEGREVYNYTNFNPLIFINPNIKMKEGIFKYKEGCLSLPEIFEDIERSQNIIVEYQDLNGDTHELEATDLLSVCIQHENDHLDGIVMLNKLSSLKKEFYLRKLLKRKKKNAH